jgi:hypothetical protein
LLARRRHYISHRISGTISRFKKDLLDSHWTSKTGGGVWKRSCSPVDHTTFSTE